MMKAFIPIIFLVVSSLTFSQEDLRLQELNNYKYIIVPEKFDFLDTPNQYQVNALTRFLFDKFGYNTYMEGEDMPKDYVLNNCLGLKAEVIKPKGGFLKQMLQINLVNCKDQIVVSSQIGKTKEKEYKKAYNLALREAFKTFQYFEHNYESNNEFMMSLTGKKTVKEPIVEEVIAQEAQIERLKKEVESLKKNSDTPSVKSNILPNNETPEPKPELAQNTELQLQKPKAEAIKPAKVMEKGFYAQSISNGYQIVDQDQKNVMVLLETPRREVFLVKDQNAIVYKENGLWYLSRNDGKKISVEKIKLKF